MNRKHVTIYDIAREAEVSPATVSRILNGSSKVKEANRIRVNALIEKYNFRPNAMARALSDTRTRQIGIMAADVSNPYYNSLYSALVNEAYQRGYSVVLFNTLSNPENEYAALEKLLEQRVDALIISGGSVDLTEHEPSFAQQVEQVMKSTPVVLASMGWNERLPGVEVDHVRSMDLAMEHLISLGHRDIGFVYTGTGFYGTRQKLERFRADMAQAGLMVNEDWLIDVSGYTLEGGREGACKLIQLEKRPTAVLGLNDMIAVGILQGLLDQGLRVPEDISVVGFDDTFVTNITTPRLTAVHYDYGEYARMLLDAAISTAEGREMAVNQKLPCMLLVRDSCSSPCR